MSRRSYAIVAGIVLGLAGAVFAGFPSAPVSGKKLLIKDNANTSKRKAVWISKDAAFTATGDPTVNGATVAIVNPNLAHCRTDVWQLPAANWSNKNGKFKYKDKGLVNGPVKSAVLKAGLIKIVAKGSGIDFPLLHNGPQGSVGALVFVDVLRACALFPGAQGVLKKDDSAKGAFIAVKAEAPNACPFDPCD